MGTLVKEGKTPTDESPVIWKCPKCKSWVSVYISKVESMPSNEECPVCHTPIKSFRSKWHKLVCKLRYKWYNRVH